MKHRDAHPVCSVFPPLSEAELAELRADIKANGQVQPIWLDSKGLIVDGRARYQICSELGIEPKTETWGGKGPLISFVMALNMHRRHLSESQRAMVAARARQYVAEAAKAGAKKVSREEAAAALKVSSRSVGAALKVLKSGSAELQKAVDEGRIAVNSAATIASKHSRTEQTRILKEGPRALKHEAAQLRRPVHERLDERPHAPKGQPPAPVSERVVEMPATFCLAAGGKEEPIAPATKVVGGVRKHTFEAGKVVEALGKVGVRTRLEPGQQLELDLVDPDGWSVHCQAKVLKFDGERLDLATPEPLQYVAPPGKPVKSETRSGKTLTAMRATA